MSGKCEWLNSPKRLCSPPRLRGSRLSAIDRVGNADAMAINHFPTYPAGEQQNADHDQRRDKAPGHDRRRRRTYSITSSAVVRSDGGTVRLSAFAVLRLIARSNRVGCCTGRSAGFAPSRIFFTYVAARRNISSMFAP